MIPAGTGAIASVRSVVSAVAGMITVSAVGAMVVAVANTGTVVASSAVRTMVVAVANAGTVVASSSVRAMVAPVGGCDGRATIRGTVVIGTCVVGTTSTVIAASTRAGRTFGAVATAFSAAPLCIHARNG